MAYAPRVNDPNKWFERKDLQDFEEGEFPDFVTELKRQFREFHADKKYRRDSMALRILAAYIGHTLVDENEVGLLELVETSEGEVFVSVPVYFAMLRTIQKEALKSNPQFGFRSESGDIEEAELARLGSTIVENYTAKFFTPDIEQKGILWGQAFGFEMWDVPWRDGEGDLQYKEEPDPKTPEGRTDTIGEEPEKTGDFEFRQLDPFGVNFDSGSKHDLSDSLWMSYDEILDIAHFRKRYPKVESPENGALLDNNWVHLRRQRQWRQLQAGVQTSYEAVRTPREALSRREVMCAYDYLSPDTYFYYVTKDEFECEDGTKIPANSRLLDLYPDGMIIASNGGKRIYSVEGRAWKKDVFILDHTIKSGDISGIAPAALAIECQYNIDELMSSAHTAAYEMGQPTLFHDEGVIPQGIGVGGRASLRIPMRRRLNPDRPISDSIYVQPPAGVSPVILELVQMNKEDMQAILGAWSPYGGGLPDSAGDTATANAIALRQHESQQALYLGLRAAAKLRLFERVIDVFGVKATAPRIMKLGGPYSGDATVALKAGSLPRKISMYVKKDSFWPRELFQQQQDHMAYLGASMQAWQLAGLRMEPLSLAEERFQAALFNQEVGTNVAEIASEIGLERIKKATSFFERALGIDSDGLSEEEKYMITEAEVKLMEASQVAAQEEAQAKMTLDPNTLQGVMPPVKPKPPTMEEILIETANMIVPLREGLDPHRQIAAYCKEYALSWKGRQASNLETKWLDQRTLAHEGLARQQQMQFAAAANAGGPQGAAPNSTSAIPQQDVLNSMSGVGLASEAPPMPPAVAGATF